MKTDAKTMAEIWREIENNPDAEIEYFSTCAKWYTKSDFVFDPYCYWYRIKPKTIIVNGVEIPKPLEIKDLDSNTDYYTPFLCSDLYYETLGFHFRSKGIKIAYKTREEAIEASKKLFGIE